MAPDIRDEIVDYLADLKTLTGLPVSQFAKVLNLSHAKFSEWKKVYGRPHRPHPVPSLHRLLPEEKDAIIEFKKKHPTIGYRRLTWMMVDQDIAYVSPTTTHTVLQEAGLSNSWTRSPGDEHSKGFKQPQAPHEQWHMDISYVNFRGSFLFLIAVLDGFSRTILNWDIRERMETFDVDMVLRGAHEKWIDGTDLKPRLISDNGPQFIAKDFKSSLKALGIKHSRIRPYHPQSNGKQERFFGTAKQEKLRYMPKISRDQMLEEFGVWVEHYNTVRLHSALGYMVPMDVLNGRREKILEEREQKIKNAKLERARKNLKIKTENRVAEVA